MWTNGKWANEREDFAGQKLKRNQKKQYVLIFREIRPLKSRLQNEYICTIYANVSHFRIFCHGAKDWNMQ